ncbi:MAG TPA: tetratricopeptide repeat protein [Pseudonocardiaceae bacterium]|jgi:hypothetical protein|nr:tetratricopeptide repeat protein [Pseudonocardiaceae bacterium]
MTLPRTVADVLSRHVVFELESIDRLFLNVYQPLLQHPRALVGFIHDRLGQPIASTAALAPMSEAFVSAIGTFAREHHVPVVHFTKGQRKDDLMHEYLARFDQNLIQRHVGQAYAMAARYEEALVQLCSALSIAERTEDVCGQAHTHRAIWRVRAQQDRHDLALEHASCALSLYRRLGNPVWQDICGWSFRSTWALQPASTSSRVGGTATFAAR